MAESSEHSAQESFSAFKNSFAYGTRSDLSFKFIKNLPEADASQFFQHLLYHLSDTFDDRDLDRVQEHVRAWQARAYAGAGRWTYTDGPFTPLQKSLAASRVGLLTSSGHFVAGDDPAPFGIQDMSQAEAAQRIDDFLKEEPTLSAIPVDTPASNLRVRHGGYDIRSTAADPNVALPLPLLRELVADGRIGELSPKA
jgi:hypothetical protein